MRQMNKITYICQAYKIYCVVVLVPICENLVVDLAILICIFPDERDLSYQVPMTSVMK